MHEDSPSSRKKAKLASEFEKKRVESEPESTDTETSFSSFMNAAKECLKEHDTNVTVETQAKVSMDWTREEDEIILLEFKKGLRRHNLREWEGLNEKLTARNLDEVEGRFDFLMTLITSGK